MLDVRRLDKHNAVRMEEDACVTKCMFGGSTRMLWPTIVQVLARPDEDRNL